MSKSRCSGNMRCVLCGGETHVFRTTALGMVVNRERQCVVCKGRTYTTESVVGSRSYCPTEKRLYSARFPDPVDNRDFIL